MPRQLSWRVFENALDPAIGFMAIPSLIELVSWVLVINDADDVLTVETVMLLDPLRDLSRERDLSMLRCGLWKAVDMLEAEGRTTAAAIALLKAQIAKRSTEVDYFQDALIAIRKCSSLPDKSRQRQIEWAWQARMSFADEHALDGHVAGSWSETSNDAGLMLFRQQLQRLVDATVRTSYE